MSIDAVCASGARLGGGCAVEKEICDEVELCVDAIEHRVRVVAEDDLDHRNEVPREKAGIATAQLAAVEAVLEDALNLVGEGFLVAAHERIARLAIEGVDVSANEADQALLTRSLKELQKRASRAISPERIKTLDEAEKERLRALGYLD